MTESQTEQEVGTRRGTWYVVTSNQATEEEQKDPTIETEQKQT